MAASANESDGLDILKTVNSSTEKRESSDPAWKQLEHFVGQLHEAAHAPSKPADFYRQLLTGCVAALAAQGGAVWQCDRRGRWSLIHQIDLDQVVVPNNPTIEAAHQQLLGRAPTFGEARLIPPRSGTDQTVENPFDVVLLLAGVAPAIKADVPSSAESPIVIELFMRAGQSSAVEQGWQDFLTIVCQIAGDYHACDNTRRLCSERDWHSQSAALLRRLQGPSELRRVASELANEGRRLVDVDRLSVLVCRGQKWRLLSSSGVDRLEPRAEATKNLESLAEWAARWGDPIDYGDSDSSHDESDNFPPLLAELLENHVDKSQVRRLVAVPTHLANSENDKPVLRGSADSPQAVLIGENFDRAKTDFSRHRLIELAYLAEPALRSAVRLDRFPLRSILRWSDWWSSVRASWCVSRLALVGIITAALLALLIFVPCDYEVSAPAKLVPLVERDVFASVDGTIIEVAVAHGDRVEPGDVLAILDAPQLVLESQRVQGEMETVAKRLEAIAVVRTDRQVLEEVDRQQLPLSAEAQQLERRLDSLRQQQKILAEQRTALTLRSPISGSVLTLDVQHLLQSRPVVRGQVLFTVADTDAGWRLVAEVPQDRIGAVVDAQLDSQEKLPVRFRLVGNLEQTYAGFVEMVTETAVFDSGSDIDAIDDDPPPVRVHVAVDEKLLSAARPGMQAEVRFYCGSRSLGYVWLHDVWETITSWMVF